MNSFEETTVSVSTDDRLSMAIADLVARVTDTDPVDLEPLYHAIDPDVLDALPDADGFDSLEFSYHGFTVTVTATDEGVRVALEDVGVSLENSTDDVIGTESST